MSNSHEVQNAAPPLSKEERKVLERLQQQVARTREQTPSMVRRLLTQPLLIY